jgi:hypothetical protein
VTAIQEPSDARCLTKSKGGKSSRPGSAAFSFHGLEFRFQAVFEQRDEPPEGGTPNN